MKRILSVCIAVAASLLISNNANAQVKIGYFDEQEILYLMPGIGKVDTLLQQFAADSLAPERDQLMDDMKRYDSMLKDSVKMPKSLLTTVRKDASETFYKLQNWQSYQQQILQAKQEQLLIPFKQPLYGALEEVIKEQKYTVVLKKESVYWLENSQDLPLRVIAKLRIPNLPKQIQDQINAMGIKGGSAPAAPATPKGPAKPKK